MSKECVLYDRECTDCKECEMCDLDSRKKCDNCGACIDEVGQFRTVSLEEFIIAQEDKNKFRKKK